MFKMLLILANFRCRPCCGRDVVLELNAVSVVVVEESPTPRPGIEGTGGVLLRFIPGGQPVDGQDGAFLYSLNGESNDDKLPGPLDWLEEGGGTDSIEGDSTE